MYTASGMGERSMNGKGEYYWAKEGANLMVNFKKANYNIGWCPVESPTEFPK